MSRVSIDAAELDEIEDRNASLQTRLYRAQKERDELRAKVSALETELAAWEDRDAEWKTATGLIDGHGDPDGIEPADLEKHIQSMSRLEQAARAFVMDDVRAIPDLFNALRSAVMALPPEAP